MKYLKCLQQFSFARRSFYSVRDQEEYFNFRIQLIAFPAKDCNFIVMLVFMCGTKFCPRFNLDFFKL